MPLQDYGGEIYGSRPQTRMGPLKTPPAINSTIKALLEGSRDTESPLGVEEVRIMSNSRQLLIISNISIVTCSR